MANTIRESFKKNENTKADVKAEGRRRIRTGIAESFTVEDEDANWILITVLKQIS